MEKKHVFFWHKKIKNTKIRIYKAARSHKIVLENPFLVGEYDNQGGFPTPFLNHPWSNLAIGGSPMCGREKIGKMRLPSSVKGKSLYEWRL